MNTKMKFSEKGLKALVALRTNPDFQTLLSEMSGGLERSIDQILYGLDERVAAERGYSRCLTEFFNAVEAAPEDLKKFINPK